MESAFDQFAKKEKERERIGKIIVLTVGIISLILTAIDTFVISTVYTPIEFNHISIIINIVLTILFMRGFDWVRVLFASVLAWDSVWLVFSFCCLVTNMKWWVMIIYIITIVYCITASALLFASRSVREYLYVRRNG